MKGKCVQCGRIRCQFVTAPTSGDDSVGPLNKLTSNIKIPLQQFEGELLIPKMNFAGPGTRLHSRLNDDGTPKECSRPVDRVDLSTYHHD